MFLLASDFSAPPFLIPNLQDVDNSVQAFINRKEREELTKLLGRLIYEPFAAAVAASQLTVDPVPLTDRWSKLKNGNVYIYCGIEYKWFGVNTLLQPGIYAMWTKENVTGPSSTGGETLQKTENSQVVSTARKVSNGFNMFSDYAGSNCNLVDSLFGYLYTLGTTFDDLVITKGYTSHKDYLLASFKKPGRMNMFNL